MSEILGRIKKVVAEQLGVPIEDVKLESSLKELGADSLDAVELVMAIEEEFGISIPDEEAEKLLTIKQILDKILDEFAVWMKTKNPNQFILRINWFFIKTNCNF